MTDKLSEEIAQRKAERLREQRKSARPPTKKPQIRAQGGRTPKQALAEAQAAEKPAVEVLQTPAQKFWSANEPKMPAHLTDLAQKEWRFIIDNLKAAGEIVALDRATLAMYCTVYARMVEAEVKIEEKGQAYWEEFLELKIRPKFQVNPWVEVRDKLAKQLQELAAQLGFTPASRAIIGAKAKKLAPEPAPTPKTNNAADPYFN